MTVLRLDLAPTPEPIKVGVKHPDLILNRSTWIISDTHFGHANIIKYCNRPYSHNTMMLKAWEAMIQPEDYVLHLGDVSIWHRNHVYWAHVTKGLPGKKFLIMGNHDEQWTRQQWRTVAGFTVTDPFIDSRILYSHVPATPSPAWDVNLHGHSHNHTPFRRYSKLQTTYYNVSVEATNYQPVRLGQILDELSS